MCNGLRVVAHRSPVPQNIGRITLIAVELSSERFVFSSGAP